MAEGTDVIDGMYFQPRDTTVAGRSGSPETGYWPQALLGAPALAASTPMLAHVQTPFGGELVTTTFRVRNTAGVMTVSAFAVDQHESPTLTPVPVAGGQQSITVVYYARGGEPGGVQLRADFDHFDGSQAIDSAFVEFSPQDPSFVAIPPTRVYDSRVTGGSFAPGEARPILISQLRGFTAAVLNVTVTNTEGDDGARTGGYCAIWGSDDPASWPGTSSVNWIGAGQTVANCVVTELAYSGRVGGFISCLVAINRADVVIDAIGGFI